MIEILRRLGIEMGLPGTGIMEKLYRKEITVSQLKQNEIDQVLAAWDTRNYVPIGKLENVDVVKPVITQEDVDNSLFTEEERNKNYVEMIEKYLHTI